MTATTFNRAEVISVCVALLDRLGITAAELAEHTGRVLEPVEQPTKPPRGPEHLSPRLLQVLDLCDCPDGMSVRDVMQVCAIGDVTAFIYLDDLARRKKVTRAKPAGVPSARYFAKPEHAAIWCAGHAKAEKPAPARVALSEKEAMTPRVNAAKKVAAHKAEPMTRKVLGKHQGPADVVRYTAGDSKTAKPLQKDAPVDDSNARRTVAPTPVAVTAYQRLQLEPDPRYPSFASVPLGVNPDTQKAWGA